MLNGLDLFSGIGGMSLALNRWVRPIAYCEIDPYCQGVLLSRMVSGLLPKAPIWDDVRSLSIKSPDNSIDILYGGFPCQDISVAGRGKGLAGERSGLFFEIVRLAKEIKPQYVFLENVPAITSRGGIQVVREVTEMGYDCRWCVISAASIGALHRRERWFLLGYTEHNGSFGIKEHKSTKESVHPRSEGKNQAIESKGAGTSPMLAGKVVDDARREKIGNFWTTEPNVGRVANGVSQRVERLRALGNAVVPKQAKEAFEILMGIQSI